MRASTTVAALGLVALVALACAPDEASSGAEEAGADSVADAWIRELPLTPSAPPPQLWPASRLVPFADKIAVVSEEQLLVYTDAGELAWSWGPKVTQVVVSGDTLVAWTGQTLLRFSDAGEALEAPALPMELAGGPNTGVSLIAAHGPEGFSFSHFFDLDCKVMWTSGAALSEQTPLDGACRPGLPLGEQVLIPVWSGPEELLSLDDQGAVQWSRPVPDLLWATLATGDQGRVAIARDATLTLLDPGGVERWSVESEAQALSFDGGSGLLTARWSAGELVLERLALDDGARLWLSEGLPLASGDTAEAVRIARAESGAVFVLVRTHGEDDGRPEALLVRMASPEEEEEP